MAISAPAYSAQYVNANTKPPTYNKPSDWGAKLRASVAKLTFTAAGFTTAAAGDITLIRMPAGRVRILTDLSWVVCPAGTATSDLDIGIGAYVGMDNVAVVAAPIALADSLDVGGAAIDAALTLPLFGELVVESKAGFDIVCSFDTANSPATGDMYVRIVYMQGN
jgi:hypothetical protein